ncbi:MAG: hypothetical protein ACL7BU_15230 [Candidatus Phlomobacter fragariae]
MASLDNYEPVNSQARQCLAVCKSYATKWPERLKQGEGLVMCGGLGTGKNHLAIGIGKSIIKISSLTGKRAHYLKIHFFTCGQVG